MTAESERDRRRRCFFDHAAENWEAHNYPPEVRARLERLLLGLGIGRDLTILDVGCGQGVLLPYLRRISGPKAKLVALDASAAMLRAVADRDAAALALHAPAEAVPLIDAYVDLILCFSAFPHFSDHPAVAREFYRLLKPGGTAYVLHLGGSETINRHHDGHEAVHGDHLPRAQAMRTLFAEAGFSSLELTDNPEMYCFKAVKDTA